MTGRFIRVFPRKTSATPIDNDAIVGRGPNLLELDNIEKVHISVSFTWDLPLADKLYTQWKPIAPTEIGGPALKDRGGNFIPKKYLKEGYTITSRGCPNKCWFCSAWRNEGNTIRELPIYEGWNVLDNNILACSKEHQEKVYKMLLNQKHRPRFSGGLEAARLTEWNVEWLAKLKPDYMYFAYDTPDDYEPLANAAKLLSEADLLKNHKSGCYVLIGYPKDTIEKAESRLIATIKLGYFPQAMLYNRANELPKTERKSWRQFQREWANKVIVGVKVRQYSK
jgi:hypothetical protein